MSSNPQEDGFEFVRQMWGNMGFGLPGMVTPTLDVDELERRIKDLQAVEGWLKINLGALQMTIQGLEVQRSTIAAIKAMSNHDGSNAFTNPALWAWPFNSSAEQASAGMPPEEPPAADISEQASSKPKPKAASKGSSRKP